MLLVLTLLPCLKCANNGVSPLHTLFTNQLRLHHHGGSLRMFSHSSKVIDGKDVCNSQAGQGRLKAAAMGCDSTGTQLQKAHAA